MAIVLVIAGALALAVVGLLLWLAIGAERAMNRNDNK